MRLARHALFVVALAAIALAWIQVVQRLRSPEPVSVPGKPAAIVWSGRVFSTPEEMRTWLRARGATYESWAELHPAAEAILDPKSAPSTAPPAGAEGTDRGSPQTAAPAAASPQPTGESASGRLQVAFSALVLAVATLLAGAASVPAGIARRGAAVKPGRVLVVAADHRLHFFAGAVALALGVLVGSL